MFKHRFLIADRDPRVREECRRFLAAHGHDVRVAADALQCLAHLQEGWPTVLVLDPKIAWGGGAGLLEWLRDEMPRARITIVLANGDAIEDIPEELQPLVAAQVPRPSGLKELLRFVTRLEDEARKSPPRRSAGTVPTPSRRV
jgi:DNA-binding NtrC family response regulator